MDIEQDAAERQLFQGVRVRRVTVRVYRDDGYTLAEEWTVRLYSSRRRCEVVLAFGRLHECLLLARYIRRALQEGYTPDWMIEDFRKDARAVLNEAGVADL